jgi:hypothetical protein
VRELYAGWQSADGSWQEIQAVEMRRFFAGLEQDLQAEADAEKRDSFVASVDQGRAEILFVDSANKCRDVPDAGKQERFRFRNGIAGICTQ